MTPRTPITGEEVGERVARHYERKAKRNIGAMASMCSIWAEKARAGRSNPLVRRVAALRSAATAARQQGEVA